MVKKKKENKQNSWEDYQKQRALAKLRSSKYYSDVNETMPIKQRLKIYKQQQKQIKDEEKVRQYEKSPTQVYAEAKLRKAKAQLRRLADKYTGRKFLTQKQSLRRVKSTQKAMQIAGITSNRPLRNDRIKYEPLIKNEGGRPRKNINSSNSSILSQPYIFGGKQ
jgi:hypothetical protein